MAVKMNGLRLCLIGPIPPPAGGMANQTRQLRELLESEGVRVTLLPVNAPYQPAWTGRIPGLRAIVRLVPYLFRLYRAIGQHDVCHLMANSGWSWHLFAAPAIWIAHLRGKPLVMNYRGGEAEQFFANSWPVVGPSVARCSAVVVPSAYLQRVFAKMATPAEVIPNVLEHRRFYPATREETGDSTASDQIAAHGETAGIAAAQLAPHLSAPHLIVTRNLEAIYDIKTAILAFANIQQDWPAATLSVAGSGPLLGELTALCQQLGLSAQVRFLGRLTPDAMAELYRSADIMLNPSLVDNSPNSVIEALACGVPVVSTDVGGIPDLVQHQVDALLVPPAQPDAMAAQIRLLITDPALRQRLIAQGLANTQRFAWPAIYAKLSQVYLLAINPAHAAGGSE